MKTYAAGELTALAGYGTSRTGPRERATRAEMRCERASAQVPDRRRNQDEAATASGALMVPSGTDAACQGPRPIVVYAHGTSTSRSYNIAALSGNAEAIAIAIIFASQGYIVIAPNYVGYDTSSLTYHPYLIADQQSKEMIDVLKAGRTALPDEHRARGDGQRQAVHHRLLRRRLRCDGRSPGNADCGNDRHCSGADVGTVCALLRLGIRSSRAR